MFDALGMRMKENYESIPNIRLTRRMPVIIRIDGKAFHTFTKGFEKPYDYLLMHTMQETALELVKNIQNAKFAYTQSDEISILMVDYSDLNTSAWFDNKVQKIDSIAASMATLNFNRIFAENIHKINDDSKMGLERIKEYCAHLNSCKKGAMFDARCFNIPREEVTNYFLWRQNDATRNSIQMAAQSKYSHKELLNKNQNEMQSMLLIKDINWNDYPTEARRGAGITKDGIDRKMPILKGEDREYIEKFLYPE